MFVQPNPKTALMTIQPTDRPMKRDVIQFQIFNRLVGRRKYRDSDKILSQFLHTAPVLPTHFKQGIGDLAQRADPHRVHQHFKHVFVVDDSLLQSLEGGG